MPPIFFSSLTFRSAARKLFAIRIFEGTLVFLPALGSWLLLLLPMTLAALNLLLCALWPIVFGFIAVMAIILALSVFIDFGWIGLIVGGSLLFALEDWIYKQPPRWKIKEQDFQNKHSGGF